jgi:hypothetical protein
MKNKATKLLFYVSSYFAMAILAVTTGCASGGYKLTRQYASWVNSQTIILRVIIYILTIFIFGITLLIDSVIFNTIDFWEGKVSSGSFEFKDGDKVFQVQHEILKDSNLKRTTIHEIDQNQKIIHEVVLQETKLSEIELYIDGKINKRVKNISSIPLVSIYDSKGIVISEDFIFKSDTIFAKR